jgi:hypothetical protein
MLRDEQGGTMDVSALTEFLAFQLRYLLQGTPEAADEATYRFGVAAWQYAGKLWKPLSGRVEQHPQARNAASDLVQDPANPTARDALAGHIERLLATDSRLRAEVEQLWLEAKAAGATATTTIASAERAGAFDDIRDAKGTAFPTGPGDNP